VGQMEWCIHRGEAELFELELSWSCVPKLAHFQRVVCDGGQSLFPIDGDELVFEAGLDGLSTRTRHVHGVK
jgi:hypothetical protein